MSYVPLVVDLVNDLLSAVKDGGNMVYLFVKGRGHQGAIERIYRELSDKPGIWRIECSGSSALGVDFKVTEEELDRAQINNRRLSWLLNIDRKI